MKHRHRASQNTDYFFNLDRKNTVQEEKKKMKRHPKINIFIRRIVFVCFFPQCTAREGHNEYEGGKKRVKSSV